MFQGIAIPVLPNAIVIYNRSQIKINQSSFGGNQLKDKGQTQEEVVIEILENRGEENPKKLHREMCIAAPEYSIAIEKALDQNNHSSIIKLLSNAVPLHPKLLPELAKAIKTLFNGKKNGKPKTFITTDENAIYHLVDMLQEEKGISKTKAIAHVAERLNVGDKTISRILQSKNKKPK